MNIIEGKERERLLGIELPDIKLSPHQGYLGDRTLKKAGVSLQLTEEHMKEIIRCANDITYFCEKYFKIIHVDDGLIPFRPWDFQKEIMKASQTNRFNLVMTARQNGKSSSVTVILLHYILFNELKDVAILANKAASSREILKRIQFAYQHLPKWLQQGVIEWNKGSVSFENGCNIFCGSTTSSSIRGRSISLMFIDEAAFIDTNLWEEFFKSVYPTISSGKHTKMFLVSTPNGMNHFYHLIKAAREGKSKFHLLEYDWTARPDRDKEWAEQEIANIGEERFAQEYCNKFTGSDKTLLSMSCLGSMKNKDPISHSENTKIFSNPQKNHVYFATVDVSEGLKLDYSTISIIDITKTPYEQVATYRSNSVSPLILPTIIYNLATIYNNAYVLVENNSIGYSVAKDLVYELDYDEMLWVRTEDKERSRSRLSIGLRTSSKTKQIGCIRFKDMVESGILQINDQKTIEECCGFVEQGKSYSAEEGQTDDLVMGLVNFSYYSVLPFFENLTDALFKTNYRNIMEDRVEEESAPLIFLDDGSSSEYDYQVYSDEVTGKKLTDVQMLML